MAPGKFSVVLGQGKGIAQSYKILVSSEHGTFTVQIPSGITGTPLSSRNTKSAERMPNGNVLVLDAAIRELTPDGIEVREVPLPYLEASHALPFDGNTMWISAPVNGGNAPGVVLNMDWQGKVTKSLAQFHYPFQTRRMYNGNLLIADGTGTLTIINPSGQVVGTITMSQWAEAIAPSEDGTIFVGRPDGFAHIKSTGEEISLVKEQRVNSIEQLPWGNLLIASYSGNFIREVTPNGTTVWAINIPQPTSVRWWHE